MPFCDVEQLSVDWLKMRIGCVTASHIAEVMAVLKKKDGESAERRKYKKQKVFEHITGLAAETYVTPAMEYGIDMEPVARAAYEHERDIDVANGGLFIHDEIPKFMASPDGRIGEDGLLEIKCPTSMTHLDILASGEIPEEYQAQMLGQLSCSGRQWVDFVSYDSRFPKPLRMFIKRFERDEKRIKEVNDAVCQFLIEVVSMIKKLEGATHVESAADQEADARAV